MKIGIEMNVNKCEQTLHKENLREWGKRGKGESRKKESK